MPENRAGGGDSEQASAGRYVTVTCLPVGHGDSVLLEYGNDDETHRILVDGGPANHYAAVQHAVGRHGGRFELLVISHIDADHIDGALILLRDDALGVEFEDIWFNGWPQLAALGAGSTEDVFGPVQGEFVGAVLRQQGRPWNEAFRKQPPASADGVGVVVVPEDSSLLPAHDLAGGARVTVLSPGVAQLRRLRRSWRRVLRDVGMSPGDRTAMLARLHERTVYRPPEAVEDFFAPKAFGSDTAVANGSSIALSFEYGAVRILLAADAHADVLRSGLQRLADELGAARVRFDAVKLPHHGSMANIDDSVLALIDARTFMVSTDGSHFDHPDAETIRLLGRSVAGAEVRFNYLSSTTSPWKPTSAQQADRIQAVFPAAGGSVSLP